MASPGGAGVPTSGGGSDATSTRLFIVVLLALTAVHIVLAVALPVSGDEAYYWDCSRHVEWSSFDQPKLVIWSMIPFRAVLGETRLAVRAPAIVASLLMGLMLVPLVKRLGGTRQAACAYLVVHLTPPMFLGSFYASTDIAMAAAPWRAWAAVALAQGERRAWWGFGIAVGLGFLAKFPIVTVLPAVLPAVLKGPSRPHLRTATPYLAAAISVLLMPRYGSGRSSMTGTTSPSSFRAVIPPPASRSSTSASTSVPLRCC